MAQANEDTGKLGRFTMRTIAMIVGLIGTALALIIDILYSLVHVLGRVAGMSDDTTHFFYGLIVVLVALGGSFLTVISPIVASIMLLAAGIAFFFIVGWWAIIASVFLFVAALLTFSNRRVNIPGTA
ncbi:MAG TPA: hypothetical protein VH540_16155 [Ktedonobacterales bacterium]|jgi:hypothetical protein